MDTLQRSEEEYAALKDNIKAAKDAKKKVNLPQILTSQVLKFHTCQAVLQKSRSTLKYHPRSSAVYYSWQS